ncbi:glycoside hydrolase family 16 protein [Lichtheimia corymbifera JMRC:FSU:9682]|uniref:Glycoside hydrolase family 16 protein n=1 Tax=Lichtheimia corymbifera JMRC:FSU:9682 TaxID=1263082 RepID=A0A068SFN1_9FUNG|nr:glycoside hydrolase family 16 protein [Lichtheimia corymbifera JMRC:FSU:9682]
MRTLDKVVKAVLLLQVIILQRASAASSSNKAQQPSSLSGQCDCGYVDEPVANSKLQDASRVWTDMWHMDFANGQATEKMNDIFVATYNIEAKYEGTHDRTFTKDNVYMNPSGQGGLVVAVSINGDKMHCGGFGTQRNDFLYGSFRAYIKTTPVNGTVSAMYLYNPQEEIDIEILSSVAPPQSYFAIHPGLLEDGHASHLTHDNHHLGYDPTAEFHEYRFDWLPNLAIFYIDGVEAQRLTTNIPKLPSRFMFNHWSDGNPNFSMGPPKETARMEIMNITAFFNHSQVDPANGFNTVVPASCQKTQKACSVNGIADYLAQQASNTSSATKNPLTQTAQFPSSDDDNAIPSSFRDPQYGKANPSSSSSLSSSSSSNSAGSFIVHNAYTSSIAMATVAILFFVGAMNVI